MKEFIYRKYISNDFEMNIYNAKKDNNVEKTMMRSPIEGPLKAVPVTRRCSTFRFSEKNLLFLSLQNAHTPAAQIIFQRTRGPGWRPMLSHNPNFPNIFERKVEMQFAIC